MHLVSIIIIHRPESCLSAGTSPNEGFVGGTAGTSPNEGFVGGTAGTSPNEGFVGGITFI